MDSLNLAARAGRWSARHWTRATAIWLACTASTVTAAAAVMVAVFAVFASLRTLDSKQMGVGLAVAVLLDATVIRGVLLPAAMKLLGDWNWCLPHWLQWLPRLGVEPELHTGRAQAGPGPAAAYETVGAAEQP